MKRIKVIFLLIVFLITSSCSANKSKENYLSSWNDNAVAKLELIEYVKNAVNKDSKDFVPLDERVAVFDMDGTIFCETDPVYYEYMLLFQYVYDDYHKTGNNADLIKEIDTALATGQVSDALELKLSDIEYQYYLNFNIKDYKNRVKEFLNNKTRSYSNLLIKDAFYKPMLEVIKYLQDNDFKIYVVSGTERNFVRTVVCDKTGIKVENVIGMDFTLKSNKQPAGVRNSEYQYTRGEDIVVAGISDDVNIKSNKVYMIAREIGLVPVLAFGNSTGDTSMLEYILGNDKYKSKSFYVLCDDNVRENGNLAKAEIIKGIADERGFIPISMKNDWKTIYGEGIEKIK